MSVVGIRRCVFDSRECYWWQMQGTVRHNLWFCPILHAPKAPDSDLCHLSTMKSVEHSFSKLPLHDSSFPLCVRLHHHQPCRTHMIVLSPSISLAHSQRLWRYYYNERRALLCWVPQWTSWQWDNIHYPFVSESIDHSIPSYSDAPESNLRTRLILALLFCINNHLAVLSDNT